MEQLFVLASVIDNAGGWVGALVLLFFVFLWCLSDADPDDWTGVVLPLLAPAVIVYGAAYALAGAILDTQVLGLIPLALSCGVLISALFYFLLERVEKQEGGSSTPSHKWVIEGTQSIVRDATEREVLEHHGGSWTDKVRLDWRFTKGLGFVVAAATPVVAAYLSRDRLPLPEGSERTLYYVAGGLLAGLIYLFTVGMFARFSGPPDRRSRPAAFSAPDLMLPSPREMAAMLVALPIVLAAGAAALFLLVDFWLSAALQADLESVRRIALAALVGSPIVVGLAVLLVHWYERSDETKAGEDAAAAAASAHAAARLAAAQRDYPAEFEEMNEALKSGDAARAQRLARELKLLGEEMR